MSNVAELVRRTERLRDQVELLRQELAELRQELLRMGTETDRPQGTPPAANGDSLAVALALAQDLGPGFSSEHSHDLAERGTDWFANP